MGASQDRAGTTGAKAGPAPTTARTASTRHRPNRVIVTLLEEKPRAR